MAGIQPEMIKVTVESRGAKPMTPHIWGDASKAPLPAYQALCVYSVSFVLHVPILPPAWPLLAPCFWQWLFSLPSQLGGFDSSQDLLSLCLSSEPSGQVCEICLPRSLTSTPPRSSCGIRTTVARLTSYEMRSLSPRLHTREYGAAVSMLGPQSGSWVCTPSLLRQNLIRQCLLSFGVLSTSIDIIIDMTSFVFRSLLPFTSSEGFPLTTL